MKKNLLRLKLKEIFHKHKLSHSHSKICADYLIKAEIINSGKPTEMADKISKGKITKFINDNTLLNQIWIMDPKKKVSDILLENKIEKEIKVLDFIRYKVGEGV